MLVTITTAVFITKKNKVEVIKIKEIFKNRKIKKIAYMMIRKVVNLLE